MNQNMMLILSPMEHTAAICKTLNFSGMKTNQMEDFDSVEAGLLLHSPAFVLLDLNVKDSDLLLAQISGAFYRPRPFILAAGDFHKSTERSATLRLGADACIGKPIDAEEVLAVAYAVQRRERWTIQFNQSRRLPCIEYKDLLIDPFQHCVTMCRKPIILTSKEFDILYLLAQHAGTVLTKEEIYECVWKSEHCYTAASVPGHIFSIRQKLGLNSKNNDYIQTVFGVGYRFCASE